MEVWGPILKVGGRRSRKGREVGEGGVTRNPRGLSGGSIQSLPLPLDRDAIELLDRHLGAYEI